MKTSVLLNLPPDLLEAIDRIVASRALPGPLTPKEYVYVTNCKTKAESERRLEEIRPKRRVTRTSLVNDIATQALNEYVASYKPPEPVKPKSAEERYNPNGYKVKL